MMMDANILEAEQALSAGIAAYQAGDRVSAVTHFTAAATLMPEAPAPRLLLGHIHRETGDFAGAVTWLRAGLAFGPDFQAEAGLGFALMGLGRPAEAELAFRAALALRPDDADARFGLGNALYDRGRFQEAVAVYQDLLARRPDFADAWANCGNALQAQFRFDDSVRYYREAIALVPGHVHAHSNLCGALYHMRRFDEAVAAGLVAIAKAPDWPMAYSNLSSPLRALGRFDDAINVCFKALALKPDYAEAYVNLGAALFEIGQFDNAIAASNIALQCRPDDVAALCNRGVSFYGLGRLEEAIADFRHAQALEPQNPEPAFNLALALLMTGTEMRKGFALYERRLERTEAPKRALAKPRWQGEDISGRTILLHAEQGFGDTLQFVRYAPLVVSRGARVILEVPPSLVRLCAGMPGAAPGDIAVIAAGTALPDFDCHCPLLSLPFLFGTDLATIPAAIPYLCPDPALISHWATRLPTGDTTEQPGLRVGLVWAGESRPDQPKWSQIDRRRSLALAALAPLGAVPGITFVSLQKGPPAAQLDQAPFPIANPMPEVSDFADTAALIAGLDLVIAVDTSVAHLAGALGKPVWLLSRFDGCWRWLRERSDSPWYPKLRLYRQPSLGDWAPVITALAADLAKLTRPASDSAARAA